MFSAQLLLWISWGGGGRRRCVFQLVAWGSARLAFVEWEMRVNKDPHFTTDYTVYAVLAFEFVWILSWTYSHSV